MYMYVSVCIYVQKPASVCACFCVCSFHTMPNFQQHISAIKWLLFYTEIAPKFGEINKTSFWIQRDPSSMGLMWCSNEFRFNLLNLLNYYSSVAKLSFEYQIWNLATKIFEMELKINIPNYVNRKTVEVKLWKCTRRRNF